MGNEQGLLRVHAVLGLIENRALRAVDHAGRDFLAAMRGEAVHEDRVRRRVRQQFFGDALTESAKIATASLLALASTQAMQPQQRRRYRKS